MIPSAANSDYPMFVADQVLTSDNLNDLFGYLDEQGRMTRTNLSGIGIVCGLKVKTATDGTRITITKGVGVTSSGYLVAVPEISYTKRTAAVFDAVKCNYYDRFVDVGSKTQKFNLWELKQEAETDGTVALTNTFLTEGDKIVLIFVELLEENNKNCDPNSCDDKGVRVTVNFRPLLIEKANVPALLPGAGAGVNPWLTLPEISIKRFDVTAGPLFECVNYFNAYSRILNNAFLVKMQAVLTQSYTVLNPVLGGEFPLNPFATLAGDFKFLHDGSISTEQLVAMQYYYDLFADIMLAYKEFRKKGIEVIGICCPDDIFPRHLLLDLAKPDMAAETSNYRHYFMPSPILNDQQKIITQVRILFRKLVLLVQKFAVPPPLIQGSNKITDANIRITPSLLADVPFSTKSIPYYYAINNAADPLLKNWNPERALQGKAIRNLSYHAIKYNTVDDDIRQPLLYDLEPSNFLRVEGHIGKPYKHVVKNITDIRNRYRLPFDIVTLNADVSAITSFIKDLGKLMAAGNATAQATLQSIIGASCTFNDLELLYDSIMAELTGKLSNEMKFFYDLKRDAKRPVLPAPSSNVPEALLLKKTDAAFRFGNNTIGQEFELFYADVKDQPFITMQVFFQSFGQEGNTDLMDFAFKAILYYIEMLYETITAGLSNFNFFNFYTRYYSLIQVVRYIKLINKFFSERFPLSEEENDHLDAILSISADGRMIQLYTEFLRRILQVKMMQHAGFYFMKNPGIQHKAGVPMGGTFILVYHEAEKTQVTAVGNIKEGVTNVFRGPETIEKLRERPDELRLKEKATAGEHLAILSKGVDEKVMVAGDRIVFGLQKTFSKGTFQETNTKIGEAAAVEKRKFGGTEPAEKGRAEIVKGREKAETVGINTGASRAESAQNINQDVLDYLALSAAYIKNRKVDILDEAIEDFIDGAVIADFYLPYLCCSDCPPIQMIITGESEKPNQPPVARPGETVTIKLPVDFVTLDGSTSSDPDGTIKSYLWEQESGPAATIESPGESKTKVSKLTAGTYLFKLTVTDDDGATGSATVTVVVTPADNVPPVAKAFAKPSSVVLSANGTALAELNGTDSKDPDGEIKSFAWSISSGPTGGALITTPEKPTTTATFTKPGSYVFMLTVKDDSGGSDTTTVTVTVSEKTNQPPVAKPTATPASMILSPGQVTKSILDGSGSFDPDGAVKSFLWSLPAGTEGAKIDSPNIPKTEVQFSRPGNYIFKLTVTDDGGKTGEGTVSVLVNQQPLTAKNCSSLAGILADFNKISAADNPENFRAFIRLYKDFREVATFFKLMETEGVTNLPNDSQVKFFINQKIDARLATWIDDLKELVQGNAEIRLLSLLQFKILTELSYYISCIQSEDIDKAEVKMINAQRSVTVVLKTIQPLVPNFLPVQKKVLAELRLSTGTESIRVKNSNEEAVKPKFVNVLNTILELLK